MKTNAQLRQSRFLTAPVSFGGIRPFVVLPTEGTDDLPPEALDHVFLHELTHIRHGDLVTNPLFCGVQALFWCNPLVWLALRQMRRDREAYCDWAVLNWLPDDADRTRYGQTILRFAAGSNSLFPVANGLCQNSKMLLNPVFIQSALYHIPGELQENNSSMTTLTPRRRNMFRRL